MLSAVLCIIVLGLFVLCYNQVFAVTFDENFAKATGVNVGAYNMLISVLTAVTIVLGMRMMGAMLISSLVIFPCALTSMRVFKSFTSVVVSSGILSLVCFAGDDGFLSVFHAGRCQRSGGKSHRLWSVFHVASVRQETVKSVKWFGINMKTGVNEKAGHFT